jgi:hypothetical protein
MEMLFAPSSGLPPLTIAKISKTKIGESSKMMVQIRIETITGAILREGRIESRINGVLN